MMQNLPTFEQYLQADYPTKKIIRQQYRDLGLTPPHANKGRPSALKGRPNYKARGPRGPSPLRGKVRPRLHGPKPKFWGDKLPDKETHAKYMPFLKAKAQANYRQEGWHMVFDDWLVLWNDKWHNRGRASTDYCLTRIDYEKPWSLDNCEVIERKEHLKRMKHQGKIR